MYASGVYRELMEFISAIESGAITLAPDSDPKRLGDIPYTASNGWKITVFNDAWEWDYIVSIKTSDGRVYDLKALEELGLGDYEPPEELAWERYRIRGRPRRL